MPSTSPQYGAADAPSDRTVPARPDATAVDVSDLLASCAAAAALSTPPPEEATSDRGREQAPVRRRRAA